MAKPLHKNLTVQVLTAISIGLLIGYLQPDWGVALKPLGDGFIRMVKMVVGPVIFLTIVVGISSMGDMKKVGRVGGKALIYFEVVTTIALLIGLAVGNVLEPGRGVDTSKAGAASEVAPAQSKTGQAAQAKNDKPEQEIARYQQEAKKHSFTDFLLEVIPENIVGAFAKGDLLQILFFSVLFGAAVSSMNLKHTGLMEELEHLSEVMFRVVAMIMKVAPFGAMGAMAYVVGRYGIEALGPLAKLMACVYLTMAAFIFVVLGLICRLFGFSLWKYLVFIREEILLVLGTSSSESALPRMIEKLQKMGCSKGVVGMVIPSGYSFNLDGTSIYLSMAALFIAQAYGMHLSIGQQLYLMAILMITSKGAAAVTGGGFVTLAATLGTLAVHDPANTPPVEGMALLLGVDRFMSEARAITNLIGNGVATICVSKWEGEFDSALYRQNVLNEPKPH